MFGSRYHEEHEVELRRRDRDAAEAPRLRRENERLREALEWIADAQRAEMADALTWAIEAQERAWDALYGDRAEEEGT